MRHPDAVIGIGCDAVGQAYAVSELGENALIRKRAIRGYIKDIDKALAGFIVIHACAIAAESRAIGAQIGRIHLMHAQIGIDAIERRRLFLERHVHGAGP